MVLALTGPVHGGKTTFLERAWPGWAAAGLACAGFLSPAATDENGETGYDLLEVPALRRRPYLRRGGGARAARTGPYAFLPGALERARRILRHGGRAGLLIVDEVGPLELEGGGLWPALRGALRRPEGATLLVVRESVADGLAAAVAPLVPVFFDVRDPGDMRLLDERLRASAVRPGRP
ncbi:MAG TPA: nucleoside-triphosphatase [Candidatus Aminicenantes bacterium]|nr:nucleoside-triphosphatase [Candidatus Aminicenantes bacterium]